MKYFKFSLSYNCLRHFNYQISLNESNKKKRKKKKVKKIEKCKKVLAEKGCNFKCNAESICFYITNSDYLRSQMNKVLFLIQEI